jgi:hypothetical protein
MRDEDWPFVLIELLFPRVHEQWHTATMTEPAGANYWRHADGLCGPLTRDPGRDLLPESSFHLRPK